MAESKKTITVTLQVKEIIYDIMNKTHLTGHAREAEGKKGYEAASQMQASEDNESSYQLKRSISDSFNELKVFLGEYLDEETTTTNNLVAKIVDDEGALELRFKLPSNYNSSSADGLGGGCHRYIVDRSIRDWFGTTNPEEASSYDALAKEALETTKRALYRRGRPIRPTYSS